MRQIGEKGRTGSACKWGMGRRGSGGAVAGRKGPNNVCTYE
jgi:hypothetical protein